MSVKDSPIKFAGLSKEKSKKYYTDIVVKDEDGGYIAIELKYKTPDVGRLLRYECSGKNHYLAAQGAENINSYFFWKDVERLENMADGMPLNFDESKKVKKGYAVLLTNDSFYWAGNKRGKSLAKEFFLTKGRKVTGCISGTLAGKPCSVTLTGIYCIDATKCHSCPHNLSCSSFCKWEDYLGWKTSPSIPEVEIYEVASSVKYSAGSVLPGYLADRFRYLIMEVSKGHPLCGMASKVNNIAEGEE